jgi:hypothetical protein
MSAETDSHSLSEPPHLRRRSRDARPVADARAAHRVPAVGVPPSPSRGSPRRARHDVEIDAHPRLPARPPRPPVVELRAALLYEDPFGILVSA